MAVGVLVEMPGLTQVDFERVTEKLFGHYPMRPTDAPEGLILHSAGPSEGGWYVYDIWESPDTFRRFGTDRIGPAVQAVTGSGLERQPQFFEVESLVRSR
jgi:hypothetical protein